MGEWERGRKGLREKGRKICREGEGGRDNGRGRKGEGEKERDRERRGRDRVTLGGREMEEKGVRDRE